MGEIEGTYRALQTPGTRLGAQFNTGISTLEAGQSLNSAMGAGGKSHTKGLQIRVQGLDDAQEFFELEVNHVRSFLFNNSFLIVCYVIVLRCTNTNISFPSFYYSFILLFYYYEVTLHLFNSNRTVFSVFVWFSLFVALLKNVNMLLVAGDSCHMALVFKSYIFKSVLHQRPEVTV